MDNRNIDTLEEVRVEVIGTSLTGKVILHCHRGTIEDIEVDTRRPPPWKRNGVDRRHQGT